MSINVKENGLLKNVEKKFRPKTFATFAAEHFKLGPSDKKLYLSDEISAKITKVGESADWLKSKNRFNTLMISGVNSTLDGYYNKDFSQYVTTKDFIEIKPETEYTISFAETLLNKITICQYDTNKQFLPLDVRTTKTFITDGNAKYIKFNLTIDDATAVNPSMVSNIQLEEGTEPTSYQPYNKSNAELTENFNSLPTTGKWVDDRNSWSALLTSEKDDKIGQLQINNDGHLATVWRKVSTGEYIGYTDLNQSIIDLSSKPKGTYTAYAVMSKSTYYNSYRAAFPCRNADKVNITVTRMHLLVGTGSDVTATMNNTDAFYKDDNYFTVGNTNPNCAGEFVAVEYVIS